MKITETTIIPPAPQPPRTFAVEMTEAEARKLVEYCRLQGELDGTDRERLGSFRLRDETGAIYALLKGLIKRLDAE